MKPLELSEDFKFALDTIEKTDKSLFITGRAGTGKSTLLQLFRNTTKKKVVILAPTGVAALNVQGQTIHSFFGFPPKPISKSDIKPRRFKRLYKKLDVLIIDEISMVRADMLDNMDHFLRINRERPLEPFGGVQLVVFGDLFQLPPVVSTPEERMLFQTYYDSPYFFSADVINEIELEMLELRKVYRQEERHFIRLLDAIRLNRADYDDLEDLNERYVPDSTEEEYFITLSARNRLVDKINRDKIEAIPFPAFTYTAKVTGDFNPRLFPTDLLLQLKEQAQVMFIRNDPQKRFVNGTIGKITSLSNDKIIVKVTEGGREQSLEVEKENWEIQKFKMKPTGNEIESETVGTFEQYPLKLAWAITIHKSQGKTFDKVVINLGRGAFEHGQTYVALSRCRTLDGIILKEKIRPQDIMVDERIVDFHEAQF